MHMILAWLVLALSFWVTAAILPGFRVNGFWGAIKAAAVFGILHWLLGQLFFVVLSIATLGIAYLLAFLTRLVVSAILLKFADSLSSSIKIDRFSTAFWGALIMSAVGTAAEWAIGFLH